MVKAFLTFSVIVTAACSYGQTFNPTYTISNPGAADTFKGGYTFAYTTSGAPWSGALMSFGGATNNYDCQLNAIYGGNGNHISFRTRNGDYNVWNPWYELWNAGNLNRPDADFTARTINSANIYNSGNLWSRQIKVSIVNPWADYVFDPVYKLPALGDVKQYISKNHHLPDIPSAAEVEKKGVDLGEMNRLLLQKIEELTLYLIEKEDKDRKQQEQIDRLTTQVQSLLKDR
jgi:hypothetical protein